MKRVAYKKNKSLYSNFQKKMEKVQSKKENKAKPKMKKAVKPIETNTRVLMWLGFYPADENASQREKIGYVILGFAVFIILLIGAIVSALYFVEKMTINLGQALYAMGQLIGCLNGVYVMIHTFLQRHKIVAAIRKLSDICKKCK